MHFRWPLAAALLLAGCLPATSVILDVPTGIAHGDPSAWPKTVGGARPTKVLVPSAWNGLPMPLVIVLHGYSFTGAVQDAYFGTSSYVDSRQFVEIHPDGTLDSSGRRFWNATPACCDKDGIDVDDVGYIVGMVDEIEASMPVDRVVVVGHSNGGFMAWRLACDAGDRFRAIASLAGSTFADPADCAATTAIDALQIHGTADTTIRYAGTAAYPGAEETVSRWADLAGCPSSPRAIAAADHDLSVDGDETEEQAWTTPGCAVAVDLWKMDGSGHIPAPTQAFKDDLIGWLLAEHDE